MIAVDTSALMAVTLDEPQADACAVVLESTDKLIISAGTLAEALIVSRRRNVATHMSGLIEGLGITVVSVNEASARRIADAYDRWGKGVHAAGLNLLDCFAYAVAEEHGCPLLYVGADFARTDIRSALQT